jgi:hypothetical protein
VKIIFPGIEVGTAKWREECDQDVKIIFRERDKYFFRIRGMDVQFIISEVGFWRRENYFSRMEVWREKFRGKILKDGEHIFRAEVLLPREEFRFNFLNIPN